MATVEQLTAAYIAVNDGLQPSLGVLATLRTLASQTASGAITDAAALGVIFNDADKTTSLALLSYQFFTGKSPTKASPPTATMSCRYTTPPTARP